MIPQLPHRRFPFLLAVLSATLSLQATAKEMTFAEVLKQHGYKTTSREPHPTAPSAPATFV